MPVINTPTKKSFSVFFDKSKYSIPLYQRSYAWEETNWKELWEDISNQIIVQKKEHFLGAIIYYPDSSKKISSYNNFQIIDGQQRFATLIIIMRVIFENLKNDNDPFLVRTADEIYEKYFYSSSDDSYHLALSKKDKQFFIDYILKKTPNRKNSGKLISNKSIRKCYEYFNKEINNAFKLSGEKSLGEYSFKLKKEIESNLVFIAIDVADESDAYLIFESINSKRQGLVLSDLLKNYFFSASSRYEILKPDSGKLAEAESQWEKIEQVLEKIDINQYIRHFWISNYGTSKGKVYEKELYSTIKSSFKTDNDIIIFLENLSIEVSDYASICNGTILGLNDDGISAIRHLVSLRNKQYFPLILSAIRINSLKNDLSSLLKQIASTSVRRSLVDKNPNEFESFFVDNSQKIRRAEISINDIIARLKSSEFWTEDEDVRREINSGNFNGQEQFVKFILREYERFEVGSVDEKIISKVSLEHILPQNPESYKDWYFNWSGSEEDRRKHEEILWNIGNLTLIGPSYNQKMSNKKFEDKREFLGKSEIETTKKLSNKSTWLENDIKERNLEIQEFFVKNWRI